MRMKDDVMQLSITQLYGLKMKLAIQYANEEITKEDLMRAEIALNSIIESKKQLEPIPANIF